MKNDMLKNKLFSASRIMEIQESVSQATLLERMAASLCAERFVKPGFDQSVILREAEYPTGIFMQTHSVAIPHTDYSLVNHTGFAIAINHAQVPFYRADLQDQTIIPEIIVMMAIDANCEKVVIIQSLFTLLASQQTITDICQSDAEKISKIFTEAVKTH